MTTRNRISNETLDDIISSTNLVEMISGYVNLNHDEDTLIGRCPFCDSDSLTVDETKQMYSCGQCAEEETVFNS